MINPGVVAATRVVGVRGDPCDTGIDHQDFKFSVF